MRGGLSDVLTEEGAQDFLRLCPHSEYVNVTSAGHMVAGDRNDVFGTEVIAFLGRKVPSDGTPSYPSQSLSPHSAAGNMFDVP